MFDFINNMSTFEIISIILTIIALIQPYLLLLQRKLKPAEINFYPLGKAMLFYNFSGAYIRIDGMLESKNNSAIIKMIGVELERLEDHKHLTLEWSSFISPINQQTSGQFTHTYEAAHPFKIEADSLICTFAEYGNPSENATVEITNNLTNLKVLIQQNNSTDNYVSVLSKFRSDPKYIEAKLNLTNLFFWHAGEYSININVVYDLDKKKTFSYKFTISQDISCNLRNNIEEMLTSELRQQYSLSTSLVPQKVNLK